MDTPILSQIDYQADTGRRLRRLIDMLGLKQVEAAEIMGVSKHVLRNWLAGAHPIGTYALYRLCRAKGIDFNYIFLDDYHHLPFEVARALEAEMLSRLAGASVPSPQAHERTDA